MRKRKAFFTFPHDLTLVSVLVTNVNPGVSRVNSATARQLHSYEVSPYRKSFNHIIITSSSSSSSSSSRLGAISSHLSMKSRNVKLVKGKGEIRLTTGHESPDREYSYSSTLSLTSVLGGGIGG
jgi:hypothetical protein